MPLSSDPMQEWSNLVMLSHLQPRSRSTSTGKLGADSHLLKDAQGGRGGNGDWGGRTES